jgi:hypothetical protein
MPEPRIPTPPEGNLKIHAEHFRKVVRRIECIKPLAGNNVTLTPTEDGIKIDCTATASTSVGNASWLDCLTIIELNVCSNGEPSTIYVAGFSSEGALELCGEGVPR